MCVFVGACMRAVRLLCVWLVRCTLPRSYEVGRVVGARRSPAKVERSYGDVEARLEVRICTYRCGTPLLSRVARTQRRFGGRPVRPFSARAPRGPVAAPTSRPMPERAAAPALLLICIAEDDFGHVPQYTPSMSSIACRPQSTPASSAAICAPRSPRSASAYGCGTPHDGGVPGDRVEVMASSTGRRP